MTSTSKISPHISSSINITLKVIQGYDSLELPYLHHIPPCSPFDENLVLSSRLFTGVILRDLSFFQQFLQPPRNGTGKMMMMRRRRRRRRRRRMMMGVCRWPVWLLMEHFYCFWWCLPRCANVTVGGGHAWPPLHAEASPSRPSSDMLPWSLHCSLKMQVYVYYLPYTHSVCSLMIGSK